MSHVRFAVSLCFYRLIGRPWRLASRGIALVVCISWPYVTLALRSSNYIFKHKINQSVWGLL